MLTIIVKFPDDFPSWAQGPTLLNFERHLHRLTGLECQVLKERMGDDSKLRIKMTASERELI